MNLTDYNVPSIFFISFLLLLWFETDIVETFAKLTNTRKLFRIPEFEKYKLEEDVMSSYPNFLYSKYVGYLTKLLSCPICLCHWLTLVSVITTVVFLNYQIIYILLLFPINYIFSLFIYLLLRKLL